MGFEASAAVEYSHDFRMDGSTMYIYFRQQQTQSSKFQVLMVERGADTAAGGVASVMGTTVNAVSQQVGTRVLQHQLARGFTVVRESDGSASFTLGMLDQGSVPDAPFGRGESDWLLLANERTELHNGQRDFAGPFFVEDEDDTLWLTAVVEGAPAVDVLIIPKMPGDSWIRTYERQAATTPPPAPLVHQQVLQTNAAVPGRPAKPLRKPLRLPVGGYYIVFDNSATAGNAQPPTAPHDDRAALISYAVQLGDPP
jgi:hypothetical protein